MDLTYAEVGATREGPLPAGYNHLRVRTRLGSGRELFQAAADALLAFEMHRAMPLRLKTSAVSAEPGVHVVASLGVGPLRVNAPCRVIWVDKGDRHAGWAYGTLPGHPEHGEEAFTVELDEAEEVWFAVTAFSRPAGLLTRLGGPLVVLFQRAYARRCGVVLGRIARSPRRS